MKYYSDSEIRKWLGHSITKPFLNSLPFIEMRECHECPYWHPDPVNADYGDCEIMRVETKPCHTSGNSVCKV